jgi:hypothetical protein
VYQLKDGVAVWNHIADVLNNIDIKIKVPEEGFSGCRNVSE